MYTAAVTNSRGNTLWLSQNENNYQVIEITGLSSAGAAVNITALAGVPGGIFNSAHINTRNIVINLALNGNIEENRINLYNMFPEGEKVRFDYSNDTIGEVYINGYIERMECAQFVQKEVAQISIICDYPYFQSTTAVIVPAAASVEFNNLSNVASGAIFRVSVLQDSTTFQINDENGNYMKFGYQVTGFFRAGSLIIIDSRQGQKSATMRNSAQQITNILKYMLPGSTFLNIVPGSNTISVSNAENYKVAVQFYKTFRGV